MTTKHPAPYLGQHYIANSWQASGLGTPFHSINPADNTIVWQGHHATPAEIEASVQAAQQAKIHWAYLTVDKRADYLQSFAKHVESRRAEIAETISRETGKPLWEALTEVSAVIAKVNISIAAYHERNPEKKLMQGEESTASLHFKPHGVVAVLGAFNFPAHLSNGHLVPALLAGNTVVYKPSELTPAVAEMIMQCWQAADLPAGVINCIQGDGHTAQHLLGQDIQGVYFTGSYQTGKRIHQFFSGRPEVILALEMGGNNPLIIEEVTELKSAINITLLSTLLSAGQRCTCARRLFIPQTPWGDIFVEHLINACQTIRIGAYTEQPEPFMGPIIRNHHALNHLKAQTMLQNLGGKPLLTMTLLHENTGFLSPGIMDMTAVINAPDEEIFAPFIQLYRYTTFTEAIAKANQTRYGLIAGLISESSSNYQHFYQTINAGLINWNKPTTGATSQLPFGGVGISGNHRPSAYFAADYCAYPVASQEQTQLGQIAPTLPGMTQGE